MSDAILQARGVVFVHAAARAVAPHLEWATGRALGYGVSFSWDPQPAQPGTVRAEFSWRGTVGDGARIASALLGWDDVRFEVTEDPRPGVDGTRFMYTPHLGLHQVQLDSLGNIVVTEFQIRAALESGQQDAFAMERGLRLALGQPWDEELEPFRHASDLAPVVWLHGVG